MPVPLKNIRDLLLPGLRHITSQITAQQYQQFFAGKAIDDAYANLFASKEFEPDYTLDQLHEAEDFINAG